MLRFCPSRLRLSPPALTLATALLGPGAAAADPPGGQLLQAPQELLDEGALHHRNGDLAWARAAYMAAWKLQPHPRIAERLCAVEAQLGLWTEAAAHAAISLRALRAAPPDEPTRAAAQRCSTEARARVGALVIEADKGAELLVDGEPAGKAPLSDPVFVAPGHHQVEARLAGRHARAELEIGAGEERPVDLATPAAPAAPAPASAPASPRPEVPVATFAPATREDRWRLGVLVVGGGVAAIGLGLGVGMTVAANGKADDADALRVGDGSPSACYQSPLNACAELQAAVDALDTFTTVAVVGYTIAGVAAAGTAALLLLPPPPSKRQGRSVVVRPAPWVGGGGGGLGVIGRF